MSNLIEQNRWIVVVGAVLIQFCLGAIYAWTVFTPDLTLPVAEGGYGFSASQTQWIFSAGLVTFAVVMVWAGRQLTRFTPRALAMAGGVVLGAGYILGGLFGSSFAVQLVCIGLIGGAGIGLAYVVPISVGVKWFPDKKGMIAGLAVAGFGFGATLWVKLAGSWFGGLINTLEIAGLPGVQSVFLVYGIAFLIAVVLGSFTMINPPDGYRPYGWIPPEATAQNATGSVNLETNEMLRTGTFYELFFIFAGTAMAGLMVIGVIKFFGIDALMASGAAATAQEAGAMAGTAMALFAIFNGLGRILWGMFSDMIGRRYALALMSALQGIIMLAFYKMGGSYAGLVLGSCLIGFNYGGIFALFPAATADLFGDKNVGKNYGWVFLAYAVAGTAGPLIAGYFKDAAIRAGDASASAWFTPFAIAGLACLAAAALSLTLHPPHMKREVATSESAHEAHSGLAGT